MLQCNFVVRYVGVCKKVQDRQCTYNLTLWRVRVTIVEL